MHHSQGHYISTLYRHLQIYINRNLSPLGFGSGQYLYFNHIANNEGITQKELSNRLAIDKATTAKAVHKLNELGYIEQRQSETDKRFYNLYLTDEGRTILPEVRRRLQSTRQILQQGMTEEESRESLRLLHMMLENITAETDRLRSINEQ